MNKKNVLTSAEVDLLLLTEECEWASLGTPRACPVRPWPWPKEVVLTGGVSDFDIQLFFYLIIIVINIDIGSYSGNFNIQFPRVGAR